jgi:hypothetical protein
VVGHARSVTVLESVLTAMAKEVILVKHVKAQVNVANVKGKEGYGVLIVMVKEFALSVRERKW